MAICNYWFFFLFLPRSLYSYLCLGHVLSASHDLPEHLVHAPDDFGMGLQKLFRDLGRGEEDLPEGDVVQELGRQLPNSGAGGTKALRGRQIQGLAQGESAQGLQGQDRVVWPRIKIKLIK